MKFQKVLVGSLALGAMAMLVTFAQAVPNEVHTWDTNGADMELRESQPVTARGTGSEIASRIADGSRNSLIYLRFPVGHVSAGDLNERIIVETHYRNSNLSEGRIKDSVDPNNNPNQGWDYFVLDPTLPDALWDEATTTPVSASGLQIGYSIDGNFRTKDVLSYADPNGDPDNNTPNAGLTALGTKRYRDLKPLESNLPIGEAFRFILAPGSPLHAAIPVAQAQGHDTVTVAMTINSEWNTANGNWINFNYLWSPKEHSTADAPSLITIPEPTSLTLLGLGSLVLLRRRR